jgi:hypothetical protein
MRLLFGPRFWLIGAIAAGASSAFAFNTGCGGSGNGGGTSFGGDSETTASGKPTGGDGAGGIGGGTIGTGPGSGPFTDFPKTPIVVDMTLPKNIGTLFSNSPETETGGPCLSEPALGAMVPTNWTPLFFEWKPSAGENVFEVRIHVKNETNDLVVYTTQSSYTMDTAMWKGLALDVPGSDLEVTVRGAILTGGALSSPPAVGAKGVIHLAPVAAPGSVVYWSSTNGTSFQGFTIGDAKSVDVLDPTIAGPTTTNSTTSCVSCHTSSPDGNLVIYTRDDATGLRGIDTRTIQGNIPGATTVSAAARTLLGREKNAAPTLSLAHYSASDAVAVSVFFDAVLTNNRSELIWTDLHAADGSGWGIIKRDGDANMAGTPAWRHDGKAIAYTSAPSIGEGVIASGADFDIVTVPYNSKMGGTATKLPGASDPSFQEYYPVYSADDTLLAFNRSSATPPNSYNEPTAELYVLPGEGGTAVRLSANDPPTCTGHASPGLTNSWSRWAPSADTVAGKRYYWLVFSSKRRDASTDGATLRPQLYVAAIVTNVGAGGKETIDKDYPAVYVGSQDPTQNNHTPAWDVFKVKQVPPR